jgi:hypothetical protein
MRRLLIVLFVAGCASIEPVEPGMVRVAEDLEVRSDGRWSRVDGEAESDATQVWTAEGLTLDMIVFYVDNLPGFRPGMQPHEVAELYGALVAQDGGRMQLERLAPATFGGARGFVFEHFTTTRPGLVLRGRAYGAVVEERLYLLSYTAPDSHFYEKHLAAVEALAASARIRCRGNGACAFP